MNKKTLVTLIVITSLLIALVGVALIFSNKKIEITSSPIPQKVLVGNINPEESELSFDNYILNGDSVYWNDDKIYISATPHTINKRGWVYFNLTSKVYNGDADIVLGFDNNRLRPVKAEYYNPKEVNQTISYKCLGSFNYTTNPKYFYCYDGNGTLIYEHNFEWGNVEDKIAYWNESYIKEWADVSGSFDKINYYYAGMNTWYYVKNFNVNQNQEYHLRVLFEPKTSLFSEELIDTKYWFAIKPSSESIAKAIKNNHLYALDPWYNNTDQNENKDYLTEGIEFYYNLDGTTGSVIDQTGKYNGTIINHITRGVGGIINNSFNFGGGAVNSTYDCQVGDDDNFSISMWFKPDTWNSWDVIAGSGVYSSTSDYEWSFFIHGAQSNKLYFQWWNGIGMYCSNSALTPDTWYHVVVTKYGSTNATCFLDGTYISSDTSPTSLLSSTGRIYLSGGYAPLPAWKSFDGNIDEFAYWNRSLNATEILDLYNEGFGITYNSYVEPISSINITLVKPLDYSNFSTTNVTFNCSATEDAGEGMLNLTLIIDGIDNYTVYNTTAIQNLSLEIEYNITEGAHNYSCKGFSVSNSSTSSIKWFNIDLSAPIVNILHPLNNSIIETLTVPTLVDFNVSIYDLTPSNCWYYNDSTNLTLNPCGTNASINLGGGNHTLTIWVNDSIGRISSNTTTFTINFVNYTASYPDPAIEGATYNFTLNVNASLLTNLNGTLYYNNTAYATIVNVNGTIGTLRTELTAPAVTTTKNITFYWNYTLNGNNYTTITYGHIVNYLTDIVVNTTCVSGLAKALCFDIADERNRTFMNNTDVDYNLQFGIGNITYKTVNGSFNTGASAEFCICINSTLYNNYSVGYGEFQYFKTSYSKRRFYLFENDRLTNGTGTTNTTLYLLYNDDATSFLFEYKDALLNPYSEKYTSLLRWYPDINEYRIVEMGKTDENGQTVMRVKVEDVDYRVALYYANGTLIKLAEPVRMACLVAPCTYTMTVASPIGEWFDIYDLEQALTFNETTGVFTYVWNDPSQSTNSMRLIVVKSTGLQDIIICNNSASGFTGVLSCNIGNNTGTIIARAYRSSSPEIAIIQLIKNIGTKLNNFTGLFIGFVLAVIGAMIGFFSPVGSIIFMVISLIPAIVIGSVSLSIMIILAILGIIVIHVAKGR